MKTVSKNQEGIAALLTVVIIGAASLIVAYSASLLGLGELDLGYTFGRGEEAFSVTDGCMEEMLRRIRLDNNYGPSEGPINLSVSNGSCIIEFSPVNGTAPNDRTLDVTGTSGEYNKKIRVTLTLSGTTANTITVNSWEERSD